MSVVVSLFYPYELTQCEIFNNLEHVFIQSRIIIHIITSCSCHFQPAVYYKHLKARVCLLALSISILLVLVEQISVDTPQIVLACIAALKTHRCGQIVVVFFIACNN